MRDQILLKQIGKNILQAPILSILQLYGGHVKSHNKMCLFTCFSAQKNINYS